MTLAVAVHDPSTGAVVDAAWYRSWPNVVPEDRAFVHDSLPRLVMRKCDYGTLREFQPWPRHDPGWFMLEWDVALDIVQRARFVEHALAEPDRVLVAPYWLVKAKFGYKPYQAHRMHRRFVDVGAPWCETFGLGCVYWPQVVLDEWAEHVGEGQWNDTTFSTWYSQRHGQTRIDWDVHPQHLHGD